MRNDSNAFNNRNDSLNEPFFGNRQSSGQGFSRPDRASTSSFLVRRLTSVYENLPDREAVIRDVVRVSEAKGVDGDVPLPGGFASELRYEVSKIILYYYRYFFTPLF